MIYNALIVFVIGAGLSACSSANNIVVDAEQIPITNVYSSFNAIDSIIIPYKSEKDAKMDAVIAIADHDFTKGRPGGSLNNWSADAIFNQIAPRVKGEGLVMCLLNVGGLRSPINKGNVTLGDLYKLMPFDNEVVMVKLPITVLQDLEKYLRNSGGEPISGALIQSGKINFIQSVVNSKFFWVITSDYLLGGGDRMDFFTKNVEVRHTGLLMRELMITEASEQGRLLWNDEIRISF